MLEAIKTIKKGGLVATLHHDDNPINPRREFDNVGRMIQFHDSNYLWADEELSYFESIRGLGNEFRREVIRRAYRRFNDAAVFLWLEHRNDSSLNVISGGQWADGFIYCTNEQVRKEWGEDFSKPDVEGKTPLERAEAYLRGEVETQSDYCSRNVYGYVITDLEGEEIDSLWGMFGYQYALEEMKRELDENIHRRARMAHDDAMREAIESGKVERMMRL